MIGGLKYVLSKIYGSAIHIRGLAYDLGWVSTHGVSKPVVSIGNLTVGGAGKTPLTILFVERLQAMGLKVCVLSRGYGAKEPPKDRPRIVCDGNDVLVGVERSGDEPLLIAQRTKAMVVVYPDRVAAAKLAIESLEPDIFILDDGFQHWKLERDLNVLVMDAKSPLGNGQLLPAGPLRESEEAIERAHLIAFNHGAGEPADLSHDIRSWAPHFEVSMMAESCVDCWSNEVLPLETVFERPAWLVSGIARPERFRQTAEQVGVNIVGHKAFRDHYNLSHGEFTRQLEQAKEAGAECILTTEKDAVRLPRIQSWGMPVYAIRMSMKIVGDPIAFEQAVERLLGASP